MPVVVAIVNQNMVYGSIFGSPLGKFIFCGAVVEWKSLQFPIKGAEMFDVTEIHLTLYLRYQLKNNCFAVQIDRIICFVKQ